MLRIDEAILNTNAVICKNIERFDESERGLLSQNILAQLRNFVEYIVAKIYSNGRDIDPNDYKKKKEAIDYIKSYGKYRFLSRFHFFLQKSASHYTLDEDGSERLMLKYYEYLLKIKVFLKQNYSMSVLENIDKFPLNTDNQLKEYYEKIANRIDNYFDIPGESSKAHRYYIQKVKPFFINEKIYYEVTMTVASDKTSKFDRIIAFTNMELVSNYAVSLFLHNDSIEILGKKMPILIIDKWKVSIRPCEIRNFISIFGINIGYDSGSVEYNNLMNFLTDTKTSLTDMLDLTEEQYNDIKGKIKVGAKVSRFMDVMDKCRGLSISQRPGYVVVRYLLYIMRNKVIKRQKNKNVCDLLSGLNLSYGCKTFDDMPFTSSLINHNPRLFDLLECLDIQGREHELLGRVIKNNTETKGMLFTPIDSLKRFDNVDKLIKEYNSRIYIKKHKGRLLMIYKDHLYIKGYAEDSCYILKRLQELSNKRVKNYKNSTESWLMQNPDDIKCDEKRNALREMFEDSCVAIIYGAAGTGKTTMIDYISRRFSNNKKIYLANTHPAKNNLMRRVTASNCKFNTIASFLASNNYDVECDILFIDECSTVSNKDMKEVLTKAKFKLLVLVGDVYQIESIYFGNWFNIAKTFIKSNSIFELTELFRTKNEDLITVWDRVRKLDIAMLEPIVKSKYSARLDNSIFEKIDQDQIVLCLNYDGLYGINNINKFLQEDNKNAPVTWGINTYKVGDPVLFNESERFAPLIYNNTKGEIVGIKKQDNKITFDIQLDYAINELDVEQYDFELLDNVDNTKSIIRFDVDKYKSTDEDDDSVKNVMPFQVAYAVSIHKAQGLEYASVKVIITNEVEERITHNIFYTAITRAKEKLKIYWTPETEKTVLNKFSVSDSTKDTALLGKLYEEELK